MPFAVEELRNPHLNPPQRVGHEGYTQRRSQECRVVYQTENRAALRSFLERIELPARGFFQKQNHKCQHKPRGGRDVEGKSPAMTRSQIASKQITSSRADRNRQI